MIAVDKPAQRVIFINRFYPPDISATSQMLGGIAPRLAALGYDVAVLTSRLRYDNPKANLPASETLAGVLVKRVWTTRFGRSGLAGRAVDYLTFYWSIIWALLGTARRGSVVVVKTDPPLLALICAPIAWLKGASLVNWLQDVFPEVASALGTGGLPQPVHAVVAKLRDATCRSAAANVVLSEQMRLFFTRRGLSADAFTIIPNWADDQLIAPVRATDTALRQRLGWASSFVVGYSGNLGRAHDYGTLLKAAELLRADPDIKFLMIGGGAGMVELQSAVREQGLDNFQFLPYQSESHLGDALGTSDLHLLCLKPSM